MKANGKGRQKFNPTTDVLVVDGNAIDAEQLSAYLKEYDVSFEIAGNEDIAIKKLNDFTFKLILVDVEGAGPEGYELVKKIRKNIDIPVVAMLVHNIEEIKAACFKIGINGCVTKPISKIELVGILTQFEVLVSENIQQDIDNEKYKIIDLSYLKALSMGDVAYEKEIGHKFIEVISAELQQLDSCLQDGRFDELKKVTHKMRATIYIMGLGPKLSAHLQAIEYDDLSELQLANRIELVKIICARAKEEAYLFLEE